MHARAGDHLMTSFQCELCHFRNIMGRDPLDCVEEDMELFEITRRANLDAFWDRATSTVASNLREAMRGEKFATRIGMPSLTPPMGPYPLEDSLGMRVAAAVLDRSLDPGIYDDVVQWETFRRTRSAVTNTTQASVFGLGDSVGAYERRKMWISQVVTHSFWFSRFMSGLHKRVGEIKKRDEAITIDVVHAIQNLLKDEWTKTQDPKVRKRIAEMGVWFIGGFCVGLRGEEMLLIEFAGTAKSLQHMADVKTPHFVLVVSGRTKGNQLSGSKFGIPCVGVTEGTHLRPGIWLERLVALMKADGTKGGRLFRRHLTPSKLYEFEHDFFTLIERVQSSTSLIDKDVDVRDAFGILRSLRRGWTSHAKNMGLPEDWINAMNRWRTEANSQTGAPHLDMADVYASLDSLKPLFLRITLSF
jgi:hypothetical protein